MKNFKGHRLARAFSVCGTLVFFAIAGLLAGCGQKSAEKKTATQVAAKVNDGEISLSQVNNALQRAGNLTPEQSKVVGKQILEKLIDQELLVQQAEQKKLDRDPRVMQALLAAKREILARAVLEQATNSLARPEAQEITDFYEKNPALFKERRIFNLQELTIVADPQQAEAIKALLANKKPLGEVAAWLKDKGIAFNTNAGIKAAEQLPLEALPQFQLAKDGDFLIFPTEKGLTVVYVAGTQAKPMDEAAARPFIEQYLLNQKRTEVAADRIKQLRASAKIEYQGDFAAAAPSGGQAATAGAAVSEAASSTASDTSAIKRGLSGLK